MKKKDADFIGAEDWLNNKWPKIISEYPSSQQCVHALPPHMYSFRNKGSKGSKTSKECVIVLCTLE